MKVVTLKIIILFYFTFSMLQVSGCDICGCSSGNYFLGPLPQFNKHFIGLRYSLRSFNTILNTDNSQFSKDFYQTVELWGGIKIKNKFQVLAFVPFNINHSNTDDGVELNQGFGDITIFGNYNLFDSKSLNKDTLTVGQQLWFGIGIKLPTGHYAVDTSQLVASANSQPGTGSFDFVLTASYDLIIDDWGLSSNINYKINQAASDFKFGNRFSASTFGFHAFHVKNNAFSPNLGLLFENLDPNKIEKTKIASTGGYDLLGSAGMETRFDKITIGFNVQVPMIENISAMQTKINLRGMIHVTYAF